MNDWSMHKLNIKKKIIIITILQTILKTTKQSVCPHKPHLSYNRVQAHIQFCLHPINKSVPALYFFSFFKNLFHLDERQNTEEKTRRYFQYIATLKLVSCWNFRIVSKLNKTFIHNFFSVIFSFREHKPRALHTPECPPCCFCSIFVYGFDKAFYCFCNLTTPPLRVCHFFLVICPLSGQCA